MASLAWRRFLPWWIGYMQSSKWVEVRKEKKREKTHQTGVGVWGGAASECGWTSDLRQSVGWSCISLSSVCRGGAKVSLRMSFRVCEECVREVCKEWPIRKSIEGKMEREIHLWHEKLILQRGVVFLKKNYGFMGLLEIKLVTGFMGLFLWFIYGLVWFFGFISYFSGFDGVDLVVGFGFRVCWKLVYFMDLGRTRRTTSILMKK